MPNLTKRDLVVRISNETGMVQREVQDVIERTLYCLTESLAHGQAIELRNFGAFEVKLRKGRVGRNPRRPEDDVTIPARAVVKFKASKKMKSQVMNLSRSSPIKLSKIHDTNPATVLATLPNRKEDALHRPH